MTIPPPASSQDVVHITGLTLPFFIGIHDFEKHDRQTVRIDVAMSVSPEVRKRGEYVSYATVTDYAITLSRSDEHIELVETLAGMLLHKALDDPRVEAASVSVTKPDIYPQADGVGITINGRQTDRPRAGAAS